VRKIKNSKNTRLGSYQQAIRLTIAVFCTGIYRAELIDETLVKGMDIPREQIKRLEISPDRDWLYAVLWDGSRRAIPRQQAERYTRPGCSTCDDYLGESADLAIGALGAPEGNSTILVRSRAGDIFVRNAVQMGLLDASQEVNQEVLYAASQEKERRERAQAFNDLHILMLDALADPLKRGEAIQQFVRLYRTPIRSRVPETVRSGCGGC
jgi:coenzyme F420 hydrogenase subunit beta